MPYFLFFFFNDTATTEIYTLSLHDALPISEGFGFLMASLGVGAVGGALTVGARAARPSVRSMLVSATLALDRKSTRLNSSHVRISYAVFCLKKKKNLVITITANTL